MFDSLKHHAPDILRGLPVDIIKVAFEFGHLRATYRDDWGSSGVCDSRELCFAWAFWYRQVRLNFSVKVKPDDSIPTSFYHLDVVDINTFDPGRINEIDRVTGFIIPIEYAISKLLPGIRQTNSIRHCECIFHKMAEELAIWSDPPRVCIQMGGKWVCEKCQVYIEKKCILPVAICKDESSAQQKERAKLTTSMRFKILERDGFRCKACGANPRDDRGVLLHVDHIIPIAKGGKTVLENLQCLCSKCNIPKSDNIIEQMALWDLTDQSNFKSSERIAKHEGITA